MFVKRDVKKQVNIQDPEWLWNPFLGVKGSAGAGKGKVVKKQSLLNRLSQRREFYEDLARRE